ncbi:non-ribosomal peptide synthetase [Streptomyces sp. NPDC048664]|uniref:non-ribosomal peptide synthetase n=1 Tax=Streptomyces sp. NPDC048664 TaxID=3154505 RepID=UPI00343B221B
MRATPADPAHRIDALLLERWDRDPALVALRCGETVLTMGELKDRVLRTAAALRARGVGAGDRVVVYREQSVEFLVALLGVVFAGAAHAALDVEEPPRRTLRTVDDCAPKAVLTSSALRDRFSDLRPGVAVLTDEDCARHDHDHDHGHGAEVAAGSADDPAVVIHTSGSTGRPKASLISHRALVSRLLSLQSTHRMDEHDRMIHHTACGFDMFLVETYWPMLAGATVVLPERGRRRDVDHLAALIRDHRVTTFSCAVSLLDLFLLAGDPAERYDGLRQVLTGGEQLGPDLVARFHARSSASLTNLYGPSECTIYCTAWVCPRDPDPDTVLIGSAVEDTELWVLDESGSPVPEGEPGELWIGGAGLALGYLNRPELTAERFVRSPAVRPGGRLYRSGDLVRARPGGNLEFLGRADHQVKIRGVRVELGEIEVTASRVPGVRRAVVVAHGAGRDRQLAAYLVAEPGTRPQELVSTVREALRAWLPRSLVPTAIEVADALPLTEGGKLDRRLLEDWAAKRAAEPAVERPERAAGPADLDGVVAQVWREVLAVPAVAAADDFFDLGGTSFHVLRVVEELRARLGLRIPLAALLLEPTAAAFAAELRRIGDQAPGADPFPYMPDNATHSY